MNDARYPRIFHVLPCLPLLWFVYIFWFQGEQGWVPSSFARIFAGVIALSLIACYVYQTQYITRQLGKPIKGQLILLGVGTVIPVLSYVAGDVFGGIQFGQEAAPSGVSITLVLGGLLMSAGFMTWLCAMGNIFYIKGKGVSHALKVLNVIATVIVSLILAYVAYLAYALAYSARDPNSE